MNKQDKKLFVFVGEASGDLHAAPVIENIRKLDPEISMEGVGGPLMRAKGINGPLVMEDFEVMGITDVLRALPRLWMNFLTIRNIIIKQKPAGVLLVDYPGFNLRMANSLRKQGYRGKIIQYVSPSVWAWGSHRIEAMAKTIDLLLTIYPFEKSCFSKSTLHVEYVGLPVKEEISGHFYVKNWKNILQIPEEKPIIALFPGSRKGEVKRNLPLMLEVIKILKRDYPDAIFALSCSNEDNHSQINTLIDKHVLLKGSVYLVPGKFTYELMAAAHCAIAKSGTVTLELAFHHCPTVVVFKLTKLNRWYAQYILNADLPYYCIVNILMKKETFPEFIRKEASPEKVAEALRNLYSDTSRRKKCIEECRQLNFSAGSSCASKNAAEEITRILS